MEPFDWTHRLDLDPAGKFFIFWKPEDHQITVQLEVRIITCYPLFSVQFQLLFNPQVEALGYVGIGFSPTGGMDGADIVIAWVDPDTGTVVLSVS